MPGVLWAGALDMRHQASDRGGLPRAETLADAAVQLRRLEAIVDTVAMLELDTRGLTRLVCSIPERS